MTTDEYLVTVVSPLVSNPQKVTVEIQNDDMGVLLTLGVDRKDMGFIIGREGETARAIRHLIRNYGAKNKANVSLKIKEPV